jgi:hypothetical protein
MKQPLCGNHAAARLALVIAVGASTPTLSSPRAEGCAQSLTSHQGLIYRTVRPEVAAGVDLVPLIRARVIALVQAGRVPYASAPDDAQAAARCLRLLQP